MDKLEHIFELQKGFQDKIKRERNLDFTPDQWIQKQTLGQLHDAFHGDGVDLLDGFFGRAGFIEQEHAASKALHASGGAFQPQQEAAAQLCLGDFEFFFA